MKPQPSTNTPSITAYLDIPEVRALLEDMAMPGEAVQRWLADLLLLKHIPFQTLVADTRLLPPESIRTFYIDPSWQDSLVDGALSVGSTTSLETMFTTVMANTVKIAGNAFANQIAGMAWLETYDIMAQLPDPSAPVSGLLFRSAIVSDWPGLQLTPQYADPSYSAVPLRFEKIGPDVMLVLFPAMPVSVAQEYGKEQGGGPVALIPTGITISQPSQAFAFGLEDASNTEGCGIFPRYISGAAIGSEFPVNSPVIPVYRNDSKVLDICGIIQHLEDVLSSSGESVTLTPASFALQMITTPEKVSITYAK